MFEVVEFQDGEGNITHFGVGKDGEVVLTFGALTSRADAEKYVDQENKKEASEQG